MKTKLPSFESVTCGRCGGTGNYSYCQMYGTTCFKCRGAKVVLTKRGSAASAYERRLLTRTAFELSVGNRVWVDGMPGFTKSGYQTVQALEPDLLNNKLIVCLTGIDCHVGMDGGEFLTSSNILIREHALAYQGTLTKLGKERKRKAIAV
jgi:hypothetical protein